MKKINAWILAARPKTLTASVAPVIVGAALAWRDGVFQLVPAVLCLAVAVLAQIAANLANDYYDFVKGADNNRLGPLRAVAQGWIQPKTMKLAALGTLVMACACGCALIPFGGWILLPVGIAVAISVWAYSAGPYPLAYHGWGDVCVVVFYGVVPVCFTYYVQASTFSDTALWLSLAVGINTTNILVVNNYRDADQDQIAGKRTTVVRFGKKFGQYFYLGNVLLSVACAFPIYLYRGWNSKALVVLFLILQLFTWQELLRNNGAALNKTLELTARNVMLFALLIASLLLF
jgi:1,4-dihydroxy-2-naphthoate octaprenyltransferase